MNKTLFFALLASFLLFWVTGCTTPEKWSVFKDQEASVVPAREIQSLKPPKNKVPGGEVSQASNYKPELPATLSVEQAVILALAYNTDIQIQQLNPVISGLYEKIERGAYDPEVYAELALEKKSDPDREDKETILALEAGIRQQLPWGTQLDISLAHDDIRSGDTENEDSTRLGLSVTQALLQGAGPAVNLAAIRIGRLETLASRYELEGFVQALVAETEIAYWQYVLALKEHTIVENALAVSKKQADDVKEKIDVGLLPDNELAAASAEVARQEQALINSKNLLLDRRLRLLSFFHTGEPGHLDRSVEASSLPDMSPDKVTGLADRIDLALKSRPDLAEAGLRLRQGELETIVTKDGVLPRLEFFMELGINGYGKDFEKSFRAMDGDDYDLKVGLKFSRYLNNREAKARHEAATATQEQAELAIENLRRQIDLDVRLAVDAAETTRKLISAARITREFEEETVRAEVERFKAGTSTALQVARIQRDLLVSRIGEARAIINFRIALIRLFLAEGSLLQRRGLLAGD